MNRNDRFAHVTEQISLNFDPDNISKLPYDQINLENVEMNLDVFKQILNLMDPTGQLRQDSENDSFAAQLPPESLNGPTSDQSSSEIPPVHGPSEIPRSSWIIRPVLQPNTRQDGAVPHRRLTVTAAPSNIILQRITTQNPSVTSSRDNFATRDNRRNSTGPGGPQVRPVTRRQFPAYTENSSGSSSSSSSDRIAVVDESKEDDTAPLNVLLSDSTALPNNMTAATRRRYNIMLRLAYQSQIVRQRQQNAPVSLHLTRPLTCPLTLISLLQQNLYDQGGEQSFALSYLAAGSSFSGSQGICGFRTRPNGLAQLEDMWQVNVTIESCDWSSGTLSGTMQAIDVPSLAASNPMLGLDPFHPAIFGDLSREEHAARTLGVSAPAARCVTTFWDGEIIDFSNFELWTRKWSAKPEDDKEHWRQFEPIKILRRVLKDKKRCVIERALFLAKFIRTLRRDFIFMRWKERFFLDNSSTNNSGLTIAGFYYICLRRSDGSCQGFYYDRHSSPYQQLHLKPVFPTLKIGSSSDSCQLAVALGKCENNRDQADSIKTVDSLEDCRPGMAFCSYDFA